MLKFPKIFLFIILLLFGMFFVPQNVMAATCSSAGPDGNKTMASSGTRRTYAYGVSSSVSYMYFPTWTETGGQNDIIWYPGNNSGGGTWYADINLASHTDVG